MGIGRQAKLEALAMSSMKLGEAIYKSEQADASDGEAGPADAEMDGDGPNDETIVDADFEEVDDDEPKGKSSAS